LPCSKAIKFSVAGAYGTGDKVLVQIVRVIDDPRSEFGVLGAAMLAAPDFKGVGADAEICGGFMSVEFGLFGHGNAPLLVLPARDAVRLILKGIYASEKIEGIPCSVADKGKNLRGLYNLGGFCE
jgi:hypothetical protein